VPLYKAVTSTDAISSRTAKMSEPVSALESRNSAKLRDIIIMQWNKLVDENKTQLLKFDLNAIERNLESLKLVCFRILIIAIKNPL